MSEKALVDRPKKPFPLYRKKGSKYRITLTKSGAEIWACGECGSLHTPWNSSDVPKMRAAECCLQKYCECGGKLERGMTGAKCWTCRTFERREKKLAEAQEIDWFDGPVYDDSSDKYWESVSDFIDWANDQEGEDRENIPEWLNPCTSKGFHRLDAMECIGSYLEDQHHEDAHDHLKDVEGLQKFLNEWCDKQNLVTWNADDSKKISVKALLEKSVVDEKTPRTDSQRLQMV